MLHSQQLMQLHHKRICIKTLHQITTLIILPQSIHHFFTRIIILISHPKKTLIKTRTLRNNLKNPILSTVPHKYPRPILYTIKYLLSSLLNLTHLILSIQKPLPLILPMQMKDRFFLKTRSCKFFQNSHIMNRRKLVIKRKPPLHQIIKIHRQHIINQTLINQMRQINMRNIHFRFIYIFRKNLFTHIRI